MMLQAEHITYRVRQKPILKALDLIADAGELLGVLGPNGAGKSTLLQLLSGESRLSGGRVWWGKYPLNAFKGPELAKERAVLTQHTAMSYDFPVEEVVKMGRYPHFQYQPGEADWSAIREAMQQTGVTHLAKRYYLTLSGGEQQRVQMARVLAQVWTGQYAAQPKLLLLDEPLNNLDVRHQHEIMEVVRTFTGQGHVAIAVLHDLNLAAMYADRLLMLNEGQKMALGKPDEVLQEALLAECYQFPVMVQSHPFKACPQVFFGRSSFRHTPVSANYETLTPNTTNDRFI